ncbi:MAG TPA: glycerol-3-phosphate dehydrogenase/oxidase, partial [Longimicrobiales bacterium]|nr:glycerol-3-phosphate dehydrogenase/oxidase [Longimicrobiales bacterium]
GLLLHNAPHLVRNLSFIVPNYDWWEGPFYGIGLKMYDLLAGKQGLGRSKVLSRERTLQLLPTIEPDGLVGGVIYYDGQFDDARLAVNMAQTAAEQGAVLVNYMDVTGLLTRGGEVCGVRARDVEGGAELEVQAKVVVNATGVWTDEVRRMDDPHAAPMIVPSQGVHIVLDRAFLPGESAIMVPKTDDGRVLFAIPWHDRVLVGTTDTPVDDTPPDPRPLEEELAFLLKHAARYLHKDPRREDVLAMFAGLRPLVGGNSDGEAGGTASLSRDHTIVISNSGLVTVAGGKWTTYRRMAEDTVDHAAVVAGLDERPCVTRDLHIHGYHNHAEEFGDLWIYGSDAPAIRDLVRTDARYEEPIHPRHGIFAGEVVWAARQEMARTVDDILARRTRLLLLDARAAMEAAPRVASLLAEELGRGHTWEEEQVSSFRALAGGYLPD